MGQSLLVETKIIDTTDFVKKLDEIGMSPTLVAWYYFAESDRWRLLVAGPQFDDLLANQIRLAYHKVVEAFQAVSPGALRLSDIELIRTDTELAKSIRTLVRRPTNELKRAYFEKTSVNSIFITEMMLLRAA